MAARKNFDLSISEGTLKSLYNLEKAMEHYPNRVQHAINTALEATEKQAHRKLAQNYGNNMLGKDNVIKIDRRASVNKATLTIEVLRAKPARVRQTAETKARFDANIKLTGRKRYTARKSFGEDPYNLKNWEKGPDYAYKITVPAKSANPSFVRFIKYGITDLLRKNMQESLKKQGIGVRGGISRITGGDVPR